MIVLTNLAHLDWLRVPVAPPAQAGHGTYRLDDEPTVEQLWTYAEHTEDGYRRVGGGASVGGDYGQGAFNADDVARAAVVYLRHWRLTGADDSRRAAYQLLRGLAFYQTVEGPNAGNVVLWMQPDGRLNPTADPPERPDPSDSADSCWLSRTIWAFGEGYAAFRGEDPDFAAFLRGRLELAVTAVERQSLRRYGQWLRVDGTDAPAWLIHDGADTTGEALLGLTAYVDASGDERAAKVLDRLAEGVTAMGAGSPWSWPFGAVLPWAYSRRVWHAWGGLAPAGLAGAYQINNDVSARDAALADTAAFTPHLLIAGGPDNAWQPLPTDLVQIAYGAHSRIESLLAVAEAAGRPALATLAGVAGAWFFGNNPAGQPMYDPATGRTFDGIDVPGVVHLDSGAESTIHGLLAMLALDANPHAAAVALTARVRHRHSWTLPGGDPVSGPESAGWLRLDLPGAASLVQPEVEWLTLERPGTAHGTALVRSFATDDRQTAITVPGAGPTLVRSNDRTGRTVRDEVVTGETVTVDVPPGGFAIAYR